MKKHRIKYINPRHLSVFLIFESSEQLKSDRRQVECVCYSGKKTSFHLSHDEIEIVEGKIGGTLGLMVRLSLAHEKGLLDKDINFMQGKPAAETARCLMHMIMMEYREFEKKTKSHLGKPKSDI